MTDLLKQGAAWLAGVLEGYAASAVVYSRGGQICNPNATIGRTVFEITTAEGVLEPIESRDFLVRAADLVLGGSETLPERGDTIEETRSGKVYTYEVNAPGGEPHYRFETPDAGLVRIHTKHIETG